MMRCTIALVLFGLSLGWSDEAAAQRRRFPAPDRERSFGPNQLTVGVGVVGASLTYARQVSPRTAWGLGLGGGLQIGYMFAAGELTGDGDIPAFVELASGSTFMRGQTGSRTEIEGGVRIGWLYHPSTEHETIFTGVSADFRYRIGALRLGPRLYWGRIAEEAGRSQMVVAAIPLLATFRWTW